MFEISSRMVEGLLNFGLNRSYACTLHYSNHPEKLGFV